MNFDQALESALKDYYGSDSIAVRVPVSSKVNPLIKSKEKQIMTREQLLSLSKDELNTLLTPFMGGYTSLKHVTKPEMVDQFLDLSKKQVTKKRDVSKPKQPREAVGAKIVIDKLESDWFTRNQVLDEMIKQQPDRNQDSMNNYLTALLYRILKEKGIFVEKKKEKQDVDGKQRNVTLYHINARPEK
jgi:hypothetical protein